MFDVDLLMFIQYILVKTISYQRTTKTRGSGDLLKALRDAGHGDEIVICDCNFPGKYFCTHAYLGAHRYWVPFMRYPNHICAWMIAVSSSTDTVLGKASGWIWKTVGYKQYQQATECTRVFLIVLANSNVASHNHARHASTRVPTYAPASPQSKHTR